MDPEVDATHLVAAGSFGSGLGWLAGALADRRLGLKEKGKGVHDRHGRRCWQEEGVSWLKPPYLRQCPGFPYS
jgi:hypothetical protein